MSVQNGLDTESVTEPVAENAAITENVAITEPDSAQDSDIDVLFNDIILCMHNFKQDFSNLQAKIKNIERVCKKERKKYCKMAGKQNKGNKAPSGFAKPTNISDELCIFMNRDCGTQIARTEVTQFITKYINDNDLQNPSNRQHIIPNEPLIKLWNTKENEEITYFTIQRHMNRHYI